MPDVPIGDIGETANPPVDIPDTPSKPARRYDPWK
jgi:hypothetical protein